MPPSTVMQGGVLPLEKIANLPGVVKQLKPAHSGPPSEVSTFAESLELDSSLFLSGILRSSGRVRYTIASSGPTTVITHPATSRNVAVIRWTTNATGDTTIETQDVTLNLRKWLEASDWGATRIRVGSRYLEMCLALDNSDASLQHFDKYGQTPSIKWTERQGEWEATDTEKQVLAVLISRRSTLGTRLELTSTGLAHRDALVLTALLTVTGEYDWRRYGSIRDNAASAAENSSENSPAPQSDAPLPTYEQSPFTRPLAPLLRASHDTPEPSGSSAVPPSTSSGIDPISAQRPITLTLSSRELLAGDFLAGPERRVTITTLGPYTNIIVHSHRSNPAESELASSTNNTQSTKVASIEWAPVSKEPPQVSIRGQYREIAEVTQKSKMFGPRKKKRFGHPGFLPFVTWAEVSRTSTASIYNDPNASIRYECRSHPEDQPLAVLTLYLKRKGTQLELTPEGHGLLVEVILTALLITCKPSDWKAVAGAGVPTEEVRGVGGRDSSSANTLTVGEEMVSSLDGWAGPPELMRLRTEQDTEPAEM
ncbi:hypothetical protein FRC07_000306 [Ceratobasidium sp. 392]|nr:hypothetical protein FRC07_000306 [Ceratobasidium sp. 392]